MSEGKKAYLDFFCQGDDIALVQLHHTIHINFGTSIQMGIGKSVTLGTELLCIRGSFLA